MSASAMPSGSTLILLHHNRPERGQEEGAVKFETRHPGGQGKGVKWEENGQE